MSNIKDILVLNEKAIAVKVPEATKSYDLWEATMSLRGRKKGDNVLFFNGDKIVGLDLPKGQWSILGMSNKLTEDEWENVVEPIELLSGEDIIDGFKDYCDPVHGYVSPIPSGFSLLKSKGIEVPHLILVKNG